MKTIEIKTVLHTATFDGADAVYPGTEYGTEMDASIILDVSDRVDTNRVYDTAIVVVNGVNYTTEMIEELNELAQKAKVLADTYKK